MSYYFGFLPSEELNNTINHAYALIHSHSSERYDVYRDKITHLTNKELMDSLLIKLIESLPDESERRTHLIKTAATIAKIAVQAVKDDETRNKIIFISLAPIISVLLILAFIVYIRTNPLEIISKFFIGNELSQVKNMRSQYGYEQLI